ncbi:MAG: hypothetical protein R6U92_02030 [Bacillota bacterium]
MKKVITIVALSALVVALAGGAVYALGFRGNGGLDHLDLPEDQRGKIDGLYEEYRARLDQLREEWRDTDFEGDSEEADDLREEFYAVREEYREQVQALLTEEQLEALRGSCPGYDEDLGFGGGAFRGGAFGSERSENFRGHCGEGFGAGARGGRGGFRGGGGF